MKSLTVVFLVACLCMERVMSLECYACENVKSHNECTKRTKCSDMDHHCVSFYNHPPGKELSISKWCASHCPKINAGAKGVNAGISSTCCETDYCNSGGPSGVKTSYAIMVMAALASLFCILRTGF
ncbi:lymphocyte antigen 6E-like [Sceloporus undulatus]|uniref:lymphocyte antigen 6E-like n=1 Tax=Sceloporus undulatus TaxID=8520 RepID=UPI001C4D923A|nr:lymphocyte antigen 6E-like [Sceloporus undulatus]